MPTQTDEPALTRIDGVELARAGSWQTMTGRWDATPADLAAAVEASTCPATRRPIIKLGHLDPRFTPTKTMPAFDGTPSIGWVENLRTDGDVLYGDLVGVPQWLKTVAASGYPNRSIEGAYNRQCAAGHRHPFSIGALALLGVTPPGVDSLRSLNDIPALFGIAAAGCADLDAGEAVVATIADTADGPTHTGAMVALIPTVEDAARLAVEGGEPADQLHCTLMYLGDADQIPTKVRARLVDAVNRAVTGYPPVEVDAFAVSLFNPSGEEPCAVYGISGEMADDIHMIVQSAVMDVSAGSALDLPDQHQPWVAHVTAQHAADLTRLAALIDRVGPVTFDRVRVVFGGDATDIPLTALGYDDAAWNDTPMDASGWADDMVAAAGGDKNKVDREQLKRYWTKDPRGLAKWVRSPHPWRALYRHLKKFMADEMAKRVTSQWYHDTLGHWPGQKDGGKKVAASDADPPPDPTPPPATEDPEPQTPPRPGGVSVSPEPTGVIDPGAEPEPTTEPKEGDLVSTLSTDVRSRLGLADDADDAAVVAALDALKTKADAPPVIDEQAVAAAAAQAKADAVAEYKTELARVSGELAELKVAAAADSKKSFFDAAVGSGRIAPAEREAWEARYDRAPDVIRDIVGAIAPSAAVPVAASGHAGTGEETDDLDADYERMVAALDGPYARKEA